MTYCPSDEASAGAAVTDPDVRNILCIAGTQRASLWYVTSHVFSDALGVRRICRRLYTHEVWVCRFWVEESSVQHW
jgi:hypothetical protein